MGKAITFLKLHPNCDREVPREVYTSEQMRKQPVGISKELDNLQSGLSEHKRNDQVEEDHVENNLQQ